MTRIIFILIATLVCLVGGMDRVNADGFGNFNPNVTLDNSQVTRIR